MVIYKATSKVTGLCYVGQTTQKLCHRKYKHKKDPSGYFGNTIKKHGIDSFEFEIIDKTATTLEELNELEIYYISKLNTIRPNGYNLDSGGGNYKRHESTCRKISYSRHTPIDCKCLVTGVTYSFRNISQVKNMGFSPKMVENALNRRPNKIAHNFIWKYRNDDFLEFIVGDDFNKYKRSPEDYKIRNCIKSPKNKITGISELDGSVLELDFMKDIEGLGGNSKYLAEIVNGRTSYRPYKGYFWRKSQC